MKKQISIFTMLMISITAFSQTWSAVGAGLNGTVNDLYNDTASNRLYATGAFTGKVAYWNGSTWNVVPGYPGTYAGNCICTHGGNLFVGSDSIYMYNGSTWSTIPGYGYGSNPTGGYGFTVCKWYPPCAQNGFNDYVYFGGKMGNTLMLQLDPFNSYLPTDVGHFQVSSVIQSMEVYNGGLYITGSFGGMIWPTAISSAYVIKYTTSFAQIVTSSSASMVQGSKTYAGNIYFGGGIVSLNGVNSIGLIKYNGTSMITTGGVSGTTGPMESYSGNLYVANTSAPGMKVWNGTTATNIPAAIGSTVICMETYGGYLFAGGNFTTPYTNIARYNANPALVVTSNTTSNVSCFGGSNGSATCSASGGLPSYTYSWSPGGYTTSAISGVPAGNYTVTVTDAALMTQTSTVTITQPTQLVSTTSSTNESGPSMFDGSASVNPSGGTSPYTYSWSPTGQTTQTATALTGGTYTCIITDNNGCSITKTVTVTTNVTTGISTVNGASGFLIYPNPCEGQFTIDAGNAVVNIYDCLGQLCSTNKVNGKQNIIIESQGVYIVQVIKEGRVFNSRLLNK